MNKKQSAAYIFLVLLSIWSTAHALTSSRGILANIKEHPSSTAVHFDTPAPDATPKDSSTHALPTFKPPGSTPPAPVPSSTDHTTAAPALKPPTPITPPHATISTSPKTTPAIDPGKKVGSITIPTIPVPPPVNHKALEDKDSSPPKDDDKTDNLSAPSASKTDTASAKKDSSKDLKPKTSDAKTDDDPTSTKKHESAADKALTEKLMKEEKDDQLVRFYFEDATLENLVRYIEELYDVKFFTDDDLSPTPTNGAVLKGHKLTFKTNKPLTRPQAWNLFLKFLDMAGLTLVPGEVKNFYRITTPTAANKDVLPTYFDTSLDQIPDNSRKVRYVFFVKNSPLGTIQKVVSAFASSTAGPIQTFPDLNALILTDKGANIRSLMKIVQEFDKEMPEAMSVLKLKRSDAVDVAKLYTSLTQAEAPKGAARFFTQRNQPTSLYFPANARLIPEPRTNSLILLGPRKALNKIEQFIVKHVDVDLDMPYSPLHIYELQYTQAPNIATILNATATKFGSGTTAAQYGGVRDGNQYFGPMTITADKVGNRLIIKAEENDYLKLKDIIQKLDVVQPQVVIEVLIVDVQTTDSKALGSQFRNKENGFIKNVDYQRTGLPTGGSMASVVTNATNNSLLGNLISLASPAAHTGGSTLLTIGKQASGVWGIFNLLQSTAKTDIISNPFLLTTNNYAATVTLGSTRQIQTSTVSTGGVDKAGTTQLAASLTVNITPQISSDGSVQMSIGIDITDFASANLSVGDTIAKTINTSAIVKNREVLVLGGIVKNKITHVLNKVPVLGSIPGLGWLFKSKTKVNTKSNLLVFISPQIIYPGMEETIHNYTQYKAASTKHEIAQSGGIDKTRQDPVNNFFFNDDQLKQGDLIDSFVDQDDFHKKKSKKRSSSKSKKKKMLAQISKTSQSSRRSSRFKGVRT
jgi:general secretion pathway protein D